MSDHLLFCGNFDNYDFNYMVVNPRNGLIERVGKGDPREAGATRFPGGIIVPGDFNAHSHPEQSLYVEIASREWDLAKWCRETIYKYSTEMTEERVYYACVRAFGRMLVCGVTSVMVSFYCHNGRGNSLDREVIRAARDTGIRLYFGRMNYDMISESAYAEKKASQISYYETPDEAARNFAELLSEEDATVRVAPALHSFHANTLRGIIRGVNLGAEYDRKVQLHLSEDYGDVALALEQYGMRPVEVLSDLFQKRLLTRIDHLFLSDCVHTDEREKKLIADSGMGIVLNGRMNERVRAGRAEVRRYLELGIAPCLGTDGEASNDDLSIVNERAWQAREHGLTTSEAGQLNPSFEMAGMRVGVLEPGAAADFKVFRDGSLNALYVGGRKVMSGSALKAGALVREADIFISDLWRSQKS